ncbi:MAG TPA: hypothetical protein VHS33_01050 [Sphingomicrobium sp.]|nr:hypothetical protein [Sphingomicrobium sp.]
MDDRKHTASTHSGHRANLDDRLEALNAQAERCRRLAGATYDREVSAMLGSMAEGYERTAEELSKCVKNERLGIEAAHGADRVL